MVHHAMPAGRGPRGPWVVAALVVLLLITALLATQALLVLPSGDERPGAGDQPVADDRPVTDEHRVSVGRDGTDVARLDVVSGADTLTVVAADLGGDLIDASTPDDAPAVPLLSRPDPGRVVLSSRRTPADERNPVDLTVRLAPDVDWAVALNGGATLMSLDLSAVRLTSVDITQGVQTVDATLPRPAATLVTRISAGAGSVRLHVPAGVPVRLTVGAGAGSAALDDDRRTGVANGTVLTSANWSDPSLGRVDVQLDSGVGSVVVDRTP